MKINRKTVLVTGSGGFIGSHLVEELIRKECRVKAFVHYNSFNRWGWLDFIPADTRQQIEIICGDIRDPNGIRKAMQGVDVVFHLAALIGIPFSYHSPDVYLETNIRGTLNILQAARDIGVVKVIHTSTSEIYGTAQFIPMSEVHPVNPQSPYAATKAAADFLALSFYRSFDTPITVIRPFNAFGPRQSARAVIPTIILQILNGKRTIDLGAVLPTRDLNFIKDTVNGFILGAEAEKTDGEVINIGSGKEIAIGSLVHTIAGLMNEEIEIRSDEDRIRPGKSEVERLQADNKKAMDLLGWRPAYSLIDGLKETIEWFKDPKNQGFFKTELYNI